MRKVLMTSLIAVTFLIAGCGGGGGSDIGGIGGGSDIGGIGGGDGGSYYVSLKSYTITSTSTTISENTQFTVSWDVDYQSPAGWFWVEFHMNSSQDSSSLGLVTRQFYYNCGIVGGCKKTDSVTCNVQKYLSQLVTSCKLNSLQGIAPQVGAITFTGNGYAILKACIYDSSMNKKCDQKSIQITVQ